MGLIPSIQLNTTKQSFTPQTDIEFYRSVLIGKTIPQAFEIARKRNPRHTIRVLVKDGFTIATPLEYISHRINVSIRGATIIDVIRMG